MKIAIFYHCVFFLKPERCFTVPLVELESAPFVVREQMAELIGSGLLGAASEFHVGVNGGQESLGLVNMIIPGKAKVKYHGLDCRNENRTILIIEEWIKRHSNEALDWVVFYFHARGASHPMNDPISTPWRRCMMRNLITNWRTCVNDLRNHDAVGSHWMEPPATPEGQYIFAGTFWAATLKYLATLPSIMDRDRIKVSGIDAYESRYEAEVWMGNGPRKPKVRDYHGPDWNPSKISTCI